MLGRITLGVAVVAAAYVAGHAVAGTAGLAFVAGAVAMDAAWAVKLGIPQAMYYSWRHRNDPPAMYNEEDEINWEQDRG
jgi:hypothetical protein